MVGVGPCKCQSQGEPFIVTFMHCRALVVMQWEYDHYTQDAAETSQVGLYMQDLEVSSMNTDAQPRRNYAGATPELQQWSLDSSLQ